jgi:hypothetical protein
MRCLVLAALVWAQGAFSAVPCDASKNPDAYGWLASDLAVEVPPNKITWVTIDECNGCSVNFAIGDTDDTAGRTLSYEAMTEANFQAYQAGQSYTTIPQFSLGANRCMAVEGSTVITGPTYVVIKCLASTPCQVGWGLQRTKSESRVQQILQP